MAELLATAVSPIRPTARRKRFVRASFAEVSTIE
jgi:hypothetical protein